MNRAEALAFADQLVAGWIASPPTNARGYSDGWKVPTLAERTEAVEKLAAFLWDVEEKPVGRDFSPPVSTVFGWPIDGRTGRPDEWMYKAAKLTVSGWATSNQPHRVDEKQAVFALIEAYEQPAT